MTAPSPPPPAGRAGIAALRYAPFVAVVLAQLVLVAIAPSKSAPDQVASFAEPAATAGSTAAPGQVPGAIGSSSGPLPGGPAGPAASIGPTIGPGAVPGASAAGDTSHCRNGRQFGDYLVAPPCVPKFAGDNGGATYRGVTAKTIKVVYFRKKDNPVVEGIRSSQGIHADPDDQRRFLAAFQKFANNRYELYGRTAQIVLWQSPCGTQPPEVACFRTDARNLVAKEKPFAVLYDDNTNTPEFFDELSKLGVVNLGGWHFADSFNTARRPFHYDLQMGGDFQAELAGEYWCKKLAGRPARYAGDAALRAKVRKAAVLYPQTDANTEPALHLERILKSCGTEVLDVPYSPDTSTANQQATSQVARAKAEGVTSALLFSDPIVPVYMTKQMTTQLYYPEHVLVGSGLIDYDAVGRLYDPGQWKHAFGLSDSPAFQPIEKQESAIIWHYAGNSGLPYSTSALAFSYLSLAFAGIQMAGPHLDPGMFERAVLGGSLESPRYAQIKNPYLPWIHFGPGDYTAVSDAKESYWDPNARSPVDGKQGSYRHLNDGRRYGIGQIVPGESSFPLPK
jgi:hypothetical protein